MQLHWRSAVNCPTCGGIVPDASKYCLNCGATISLAPLADSLTQWEEANFVYRFPNPKPWVRLATATTNGFTLAGARMEFWQAYEQTIRAELQKHLDQGWILSESIGPTAIPFGPGPRPRWPPAERFSV